jgi:hypothetical protein
VSTVTNLSAGDYLISAIATDNGGAKATNAITLHIVTPVPIVLSQTQRLSSGDFQFNYSANPGLKYVVQRSADFSHWIPIATNTATAGDQMFRDQDTTGTSGFYRVGLLPNP